MIEYIKIAPKIIRNMGWRYSIFRAGYEIKRKIGLLKSKYPINPEIVDYVSLADWRILDIKFFFDSKEALTLAKIPNLTLESDYKKLMDENYLFFGSTYFRLKNYDWVSNPITGYKYDSLKHWTLIEDTILEAGDIKYVWELSRFSFIYTVIRYDYHFQKDCSFWVFDKIENWIDSNPINCGPNYKCSQEISLRVLNWTFALNYYKNSKNLTKSLFRKIIHNINWQINHVYENIQFSLKSVRNNHAIAESLTLYITGLLYPFLPNAKIWKRDGKKWLEEEIEYQIYEDGSYLMFSNNYQRTVLVMLTWLLYLANANREKLKETSYKKIYAAFNFLYQCQDDISGQLPNYGHNDGSLFCKLNDTQFRDYRSQLNAVYFYFSKKMLYPEHTLVQEETFWLNQNFKKTRHTEFVKVSNKTTCSFTLGGYFIMREEESLTFVRCGSHKDRPSQADNLHIDIWYKGINIVRDAGTYKYNTDSELVNYFSGTSAHNTASLGDADQMEKGPGFIWLNWSQSLEAAIEERDDIFIFNGKIRAFQHLGSNIVHTRTIMKSKNRPEWCITDSIAHDTTFPLSQYWNISEEFLTNFSISAIEENGKLVTPTVKNGYYSGLYGQKEVSQVLVFETKSKMLTTKISLK